MSKMNRRRIRFETLNESISKTGCIQKSGHTVLNSFDISCILDGDVVELRICKLLLTGFPTSIGRISFVLHIPWLDYRRRI